MKKNSYLAGIAFLFILCQIVFAEKSGINFDDFPVKISGNLRIYLYDEVSGEVDGKSQETNSSGGFTWASLIIDRNFEDKLLIHAETIFENTAVGATPYFVGMDFGRQWGHDITTEFLTANFTYIFDNGIEVKAGLIKPLFTWEYGYELYWNEKFHGSVVAANLWLAYWNDAGLEIKKTFDFNSFQLPVYLYALNGRNALAGNGKGNEYVDNNDSRSFMIHLAPIFMQEKLRLLASFGSGKWDDNDEKRFSKWAFGINYDWSKLRLRAEYIGGEWEDFPMFITLNEETLNPNGYYVKGIFHASDRVDIVAAYSEAHHDFSGFNAPFMSFDEDFKEYSLGINFTLYGSVTIMADWTHKSIERDLNQGELFGRLARNESLGLHPVAPDPSLPMSKISASGMMTARETEYDRFTLGARINF